MTDTVLGALLASHETVAIAMSFVLYYLADHPDVYAKVLKEMFSCNNWLYSIPMVCRRRNQRCEVAACSNRGRPHLETSLGDADDRRYIEVNTETMDVEEGNSETVVPTEALTNQGGSTSESINVTFDETNPFFRRTNIVNVDDVDNDMRTLDISETLQGNPKEIDLGEQQSSSQGGNEEEINDASNLDNSQALPKDWTYKKDHPSDQILGNPSSGKLSTDKLRANEDEDFLFNNNMVSVHWVDTCGELVIVHLPFLADHPKGSPPTMGSHTASSQFLLTSDRYQSVESE
ncbi:hypothetical protein RJ640_000675 [Escallonia rubra]|uniref:Uncharacterized protein n=1 Tax=Escallonia rubra TaxID=112253 RepID=A0AA88R5D9_9ASTE|nr:hypothetical protein RJ640_000675 [Escallonia rubra]